MGKQYDKNGRPVPDLNIMHDNDGNPIKIDNCGGLFDDRSLDEMLRVKSYQIAFGLFRAMLITMVAISIMLWVFVVYESSLYMIASAAIASLTVMVFCILYAALTSAQGIMNPKFAAAYSQGAVIGIWIFVLAVWIMALIFSLEDWEGVPDAAKFFFWIGYSLSNIIVCIFARKNNKIVKMREQEAEENDEQ